MNNNNNNNNMNINIMVAYCKNNGIGYKNSLPWKVKSDMQKFRKYTLGIGNNAIIMGKNTWLSLNSKPLPRRDNLILSTSLFVDEINPLPKTNPDQDQQQQQQKQHISKSFINVEELEEFVKTRNYDRVWIIGGEKIYNYFLNEYPQSKSQSKTQAILTPQNIYVTYLDQDFACDTFFPVIDLNRYKLTYETSQTQDMNYTIMDRIYERIYLAAT